MQSRESAAGWQADHCRDDLGELSGHHRPQQMIQLVWQRGRNRWLIARIVAGA